MVRALAPADYVTLANAASGTAAIFMCLRFVAEQQRGALWAAVGLLFVALLCDIMDGTVARRGRGSSPFGGDLDSLSDVISFGVAPASMAYALGMRGLLDILILVYFVCCGVARLARFNVTAEALTDDRGKVSYFEGTPIPSSMVLVLVMALLFAWGDPVHLWGGPWALGPLMVHPLTLFFALNGSTMISSRLRIPKP